MYEITNDSAWKKTLELIESKFGKKLSYRSMKIVSENESAFYSQGDDLIIPLRLKNHDLGDVIVDRGSLLDSQQKTELVDLVKFLVEPKVYSIHLKKSEENAVAQKSSKQLVTLELFKSEPDQRRTLSQVIHLKATVEKTRWKVASKIHEMTGRNLFVHLSDIAASLSSVEDIKTLTDTTIYIDSIEQLSASMIELLQKYLENSFDDGPLFLIGSNMALVEVQNKPWPDTFKNDLMGFYFDIDRVPAAQQTSEEILELLFFQLDAFST